MHWALDRHTILCLYIPEFWRQIYKYVKILSKRSKEKIKTKEDLSERRFCNIRLYLSKGTVWPRNVFKDHFFLYIKFCISLIFFCLFFRVEGRNRYLGQNTIYLTFRMIFISLTFRL